MIILSIEVKEAPEGLEAMYDRLSAACCTEEGIVEMVSFGRLVDDDAIHQLNREFRNVDRSTDVLSFPSIEYRAGQTAKDSLKKLQRERDPESGLMNLGDFVVSLPTAKVQAETYGHSLMRELCYLAAHAQFHLMGYDHMTEDEKRIMREKEERVMTALGLVR